MSLRVRITLLIAVLLTVTTISSTVLLVWLDERAVISRAIGDGVALARLLTNGVSLAEQLPLIVDHEISRQMAAEAALAAQIVDIADQAKLPGIAVSNRFAEVIARTTINKVTILGNDGRVIAGSGAQLDPASHGEDEPGLLQAFGAIASGRLWVERLDSTLIEGSELVMAYAGVGTPDGKAIAIVGQNTTDVSELRREIGPERNIAAMVGDANIIGIWIFGEKRDLVARATVGASASDRTPDETEQLAVARVIQTGLASAFTDGDVIHVISPVLDPDRLPIGAGLIRFSMAELHAEVRRNILVSIALTVILLAAGTLASGILSRKISAPIILISNAARAVHNRQFDPLALKSTAERKDEIGSLAVHFTVMAQQVLAREEELDRQVTERTRELNERNRDLTAAIDVIQTDLDAARALQLAILPQRFPEAPSFDGVALMTAARHVGGDFYDFFMVDDDHLAIIIADVSGKGIPAALFMAVSRTILRATAMVLASPSECIERANDEICTQNPLDLFITVFYGLLDIRTGEFRFVNAGHPQPVLVRPAGAELAELPLTGGMALGVINGVPYAEDSVTLEPGDALILYTDGVSEAMNQDYEEFTVARVLTALAAKNLTAAPGMMDALISSVHEFVGDAPQSDDITCVVVQFQGTGTSSPSADAATVDA